MKLGANNRLSKNLMRKSWEIKMSIKDFEEIPYILRNLESHMHM